MLVSIQHTFYRWTSQMERLLRNEILDLEPHEYCIGMVFVIAIGFVMLSGRR